MPCAAGVEGFLADEIHQITGLTGQDLLTGRGGVLARASWRDAQRINLHSRLTQRVLEEAADLAPRRIGDDPVDGLLPGEEVAMALRSTQRAWCTAIR